MSSLHAVPSPGRRAVTLALTGVLALLMGGCGVRLQEDAPDLPLVPRRPKMPGEEVLLGLLGDTVGLVAATSAASGEVEKALADLHVAQERVLRDALRRGGVPSAVIGAGASPGPTNPATLVAMEAAASHDRGRYAALSPELGRVVLTLLAQRLAASQILGTGAAAASPTPSPNTSTTGSTSPSPPPSPADAGLGGLLTAAREAANWVEVAQARGPKKDDTTGEAALMTSISTWLRKRITLWEGEIGADGPEAPVAVPLPFPVEDAASRTALVTRGIEGVRTAYGRRVEGLSDAAVADAWATIPDDLADIEVHVHTLGGPLQAFPGLS